MPLITFLIFLLLSQEAWECWRILRLEDYWKSMRRRNKLANRYVINGRIIYISIIVKERRRPKKS